VSDATGSSAASFPEAIPAEVFVQHVSSHPKYRALCNRRARASCKSFLPPFARLRAGKDSVEDHTTLLPGLGNCHQTRQQKTVFLR
jgi:hypothetical protein